MFCVQVIAARLGEASEQMAAVSKGLSAVVGDVCWIYTWQELETMICGSPDIDVEEVCFSEIHLKFFSPQSLFLFIIS